MATLLEAHIQALRATHAGGVAPPSYHPSSAPGLLPATYSRGVAPPSRPPPVELESPCTWNRHASPPPDGHRADHLSTFEAALASFGPEDNPRGASSAAVAHTNSMDTSPPPMPSSLVAESYYEDLVQATVRNAWNKAWGAYQRGSTACSSSSHTDDAVIQGTGRVLADAPSSLPSLAVTPRRSSPHRGPPPSIVSSSCYASPHVSWASTTTGPPSRSTMHLHPHRVASAKRAPTSYMRMREQRLQQLGP